MAAKISELFDKVELSPAVADGTVLKLIYNETKNTLMINLALDDTVSASEILSLGNTLTQYLDGTEVFSVHEFHKSSPCRKSVTFPTFYHVECLLSRVWAKNPLSSLCERH